VGRPLPKAPTLESLLDGPKRAIEPGRAPIGDDLPLPPNPKAIPFDLDFVAVGLQDAIGVVGSEHVFDVSYLDRHAAPHFGDDFLQTGRPVKGSSVHLPDDEPDRVTPILEIQDRTQPVGAIGVPEGALQPCAAVGAADFRAQRVYRTAALRNLMETRTSTQLCEFVYP